MTRLDDLPRFDQLWRNPYSEGVALFHAMGGVAVEALMENSEERLLLLECDDTTALIPWEYAATPEGYFISCKYYFLRLNCSIELPEYRIETTPSLIIACSEPIWLDTEFAKPPLGIEKELTEIKHALNSGDRSIVAERVPATIHKLREAIARKGGREAVLLHLSCHGEICFFQYQGRVLEEVRLYLEDDNGLERTILGRDLVQFNSERIGLIFLSACQTAHLARALAKHGIPITIGMHHNVPDVSSIKISSAFYGSIVNGNTIGDALRQARTFVLDSFPHAVGLLTAYVNGNTWRDWTLPYGKKTVSLDLPIYHSLPYNIEVSTPATGLIGREREMFEIVTAFMKDASAVVIAGPGGIGKTSIAGGFIKKFGWHFRRVYGVSFTFTGVDPERVCKELAARLDHISQNHLQAQDDTDESRHLLDTSLLAPEIGGLPLICHQFLHRVASGDLIVIDNFESIAAPRPDDTEKANQVFSLLMGMINKGVRLLITSQSTSIDIPGAVFITGNTTTLEQGDMLGRTISGLDPRSGETLFIKMLSHVPELYSTSTIYKQVANRIAVDTNGHPLAISLLARSFEKQGISPVEFLDNWFIILKNASQKNLDARLRTINHALEYSLSCLTEDDLVKIYCLAAIGSPFFAEAAAFAWNLNTSAGDEISEDIMHVVHGHLSNFLNLCLLESNHKASSGSRRVAYQFHPVVQKVLLLTTWNRKMDISSEKEAYYAWLLRLARSKQGTNEFPYHVLQPVLEDLMDRPRFIPELHNYKYTQDLQEVAAYYSEIPDNRKNVIVAQKIRNLLGEYTRLSVDLIKPKRKADNEDD